MSVCTVSKRSREWSDQGGIPVNDLKFLESNEVPFCNAPCVMGLF